MVGDRRGSVDSGRLSASANSQRRARLWTKWLLFPGFDVKTRKRMRLARYLLAGDVATLEAGCGNGAFSYQAYRLGNRVLGISNDPDQVQRCNEFRDFLGMDATRCRFKVHNIYDLLALGQRFDQIICFETLELLERDQEVIKLFARVLNPGGLLHVCTPYLHRTPYWGERISSVEDGEHMRLGYTFEIVEKMLSNEGFEVVARDRVVGPVSQMVMDWGRWLADVPLKRWPAVLRNGISGMVIFSLLPSTWIDVCVRERRQLCIYVKARLKE